MKAEVLIPIPKEIIDRLQACKLNAVQTTNFFRAYMTELMTHPYNHFYDDFDIWLEGLNEGEFEKLKHN